VLTRVQSECLTGDGLFSLRCDCGPQLKAAVKLRRVMTNNPAKLEALTRLGVEITERAPLRVRGNRHNARYLATKACRMGHLP
jgi:GTP cyclohydrolase II